MSPFPFEPKMSGAASSASGGLPAGAFASEAGAKASRTSAELKRSFASMLGQVKKEAPSASSAAPAVKSAQGSDIHPRPQQALEGAKSKSSHSSRSSAAETRARSTRDPEGRVDDSGEQELPTDLPAHEQAETAMVSSDIADVVALAPAWVPQPLPIEDAAPFNLCAVATQLESAPIDEEASALAITTPTSPTSGSADERVRPSVQAMPAILKQNEVGSEGVPPTAFAAAQTPPTQTPVTPSPVPPTRQAEGVRLNFNDAAIGKALNTDGEPSTPPDEAGAFKLPAGLNAVSTQPAPNLPSATMPRSLKAEKTAALSSATSAKGDESTVNSVFNKIEN
ncbi:MAG: hypothetical protein EBU32_11870, partial [Opitutaceae bacterium]|nr:hypothetical protein [Opitutaceae bacterium]